MNGTVTSVDDTTADAADARREPPFGPATSAWFERHFERPTEVQRLGWRAISSGRNALLLAPTGSGKTLAAFLWSIDRLADRPADAERGVRVLYVSPLKALVYDVDRNLRAPLAGVRHEAELLGDPVQPITVDVRTGDTPQRERQRMARDPGEILVTTPESLYLMLGSRAREVLRTVETVIVDEVHALCPTKRGVHLALSLERLEELCERPLQRIGLSATVRPADEVAAFLGGARPVDVVDASARPRLDLEVCVPVEDMRRPHVSGGPREPGGSVLAEIYREEERPRERGIWPVIVPELLREVRAHTSTIVFVNNRALCERLAHEMNELAQEELVQSHHGSVSHEQRAVIEDQLKSGALRGLIATSSLELGIDMGAVDCVLLVESPGTVARGLQRVGRAGHQVGARSRGRVYPKHPGDLLESTVVAERMLRGEIEEIAAPRNALDVLAQQVVAMCCDAPRTPAELATVVRRAHPYRDLSDGALQGVLEMLSGHYPSHSLAELRPRLRWDRASDTLGPRRGTQLAARLNAGTIPDRGTFPVTLGPDGPRVGELDEEMVHESRAGETFVLGSTTWRIEEIERDRVIVSPAPGEPGRMPFWRGEGPGRPVELGRAQGAFLREAGEVLARGDEPLDAWLRERVPLSELAARNLAAWLTEQHAATGVLPSDRTILVERFRDELGDWRVCLHSPYGRRVHAPLAIAIEEALSRATGTEFQCLVTDDGIVLRFADTDDLPELEELFPDPDELTERVTERVASTALFASLFRENAVRALLVTRRRPGQRNPLWAQRIRTRALLAEASRHADFPIVLETYRQALSDVFDLQATRELLERVRDRRVAVREVVSEQPSPFARSAVFAWVAAYLYDGDSPSAERRAQALTLDRTLLAELLGSSELRTLLDAEALDELERELTGLASRFRARDRDELHDLLRRIGDLGPSECAARAEGASDAWLIELERERRAARVTVAGQPRWIAAEDAGLYRDALGLVPPSGLPSAFLSAVTEPVQVLLARFAAGRGPFTSADACRRFGLSAGQSEAALGVLRRQGILVRGELRPGGVELEWCDADVLRRLKRRSLAKLRGTAAPVGGDAFARFLPRWQQVERTEGSLAPTLADAVVRLEGVAIPWSDLITEVLPARVPGFALDALDLLAATGQVSWVGRGALGARDGRVVLCRREEVANWVDPAPDPEGLEPIAQALLDALGRRGACFTTELEREVRGRVGEHAAGDLERALLDLAFRGLVTNDTFGPLRSLRSSVRAGRGRIARARAFAGGRWSRTSDLVGELPSDTERLLARARTLVERYGVVSREAFLAESLPGGFGPYAKVLRALEEAGSVLRGWFVDGIGGAQFARTAAVDRLRLREESGTEPRPLVLAACDPAQPYGSLLAWPESPASPKRVAGALVGLVDGRCAWYLAPGRRKLVVFEREKELLVPALRALLEHPRRGRRMLSIEEVDGATALDTDHAASLREAGFAMDHRGFVPAAGAPA